MKSISRTIKARSAAELAPVPAQQAAQQAPAQRHALAPERSTAHHPAAATVPIGPVRSDGLPTGLRRGIEALSGLAMDDVRVHRNSPQPAKLAAHAFAQGNEIHLAPGQDKHLPHEAWHVVQQKQGRVQANGSVGSTPINDDRSLEAEAEAMGVRAGEAARPDPNQRPAIRPAPARRDTPIQGFFTFVAKRFVYNADSLRAEIKEIPDYSIFFSEAQNVDAVLAKIKAWAESEVDEGFKGKNFPQLIKAAVTAVSEDRLKLAPKEPIKLPTSSETPFDPKDILSKPMDNKIERLREIHRSASLNATALNNFRDRSQMQHITHCHYPSVQYGIASITNFMLGGKLPPDYKELIHTISMNLGINGPALARALLSALDGKKFSVNGKPYDELPIEAITKFVALILGPELRRAAINPVAVRAALEYAVRNGGDIFDVLRENALLFAAEPKDQCGKGLGGSMRSQFHRRKVQEDEDFNRIAQNQHDRIAEYVSRRGIDMYDEDKMKAFMQVEMQRLVDIHKMLFGSKSEVEKTGSLASAASMRKEGGIEDNREQKRPSTRDGYGLRERQKRKQLYSPNSNKTVNEAKRDLKKTCIDYASHDGRRYYPNTEGIDDRGQCLWDTMKRYGCREETLRLAAQMSGLVYNDYTDIRSLTKFVTTLNSLVDQKITIRVDVFDLITLDYKTTVEFGNGDKIIDIGLFYVNALGHYVPPS